MKNKKQTKKVFDRVVVNGVVLHYPHLQEDVPDNVINSSDKIEVNKENKHE